MRLRTYILNKLAQQVVLPGMFDRSRDKKTYYAPYSGEVDGQKYWNCYSCGEVLKDDETGELTDNKNDVTRWYNLEKEEASGSENIAELKNKLLVKLNNLKNTAIKLNKELVELGKSEIDPIKNHQAIINLKKSGIDSDKAEEIRVYFNRIVKDIFERLNQACKEQISTEIAETLKLIKYYYHYSTQSDEDEIEQSIKYINLNKENFFGGRFHIPYHIYIANEGLIDRITSFYKERMVSEPLEKIITYSNLLISLVEKQGDISESKINKYKIKYPLCERCADDWEIECGKPNCGFKSKDQNDFLDIAVGRDEDVTMCTMYCAFHCNSCNRNYMKEDKDQIVHEGESYCSDCFWETYNSCEDCQEYILSEHSYYDDDDGPFCESCHRSRKAGTLSEDLSRDVEETIIKPISQVINYPLDTATISGKIIPLLGAAAKKGIAVERLPAFFEERKATFGKMADVILATIKSESADKSRIEDIISNFERQAGELQRFKTEYPRIKEPKLLPVTIRQEEARTGSGFVFAIYPNQNTFNIAEAIQPGAKEAYDLFLKRKGHHDGALAYIRFSIDENDNFIINNLQTDLDPQAFKKEELTANPALVWWLKSIQNFWIVYLLDFARKIGKQLSKKVYLTSFDMQKDKWGRIPDRSKDVYDKIPAEMGFARETIFTQPESMRPREYEMTRIANLFIEAFKLIKI